MIRIRLASLGALIGMLAIYATTAFAADASVPPVDTDIVPAGGITVDPAQPLVIHDQVSTWTYTVVAALAIAATLLVLLLVNQVRRVTTASPSPRP